MGYTFTEKGANRIVDAVRKVEQMAGGGMLRNGNSIVQDTGQWVKIVDQDPTDRTKYAFIKVGHDQADGIEDKEISSVRNAVEEYTAIELHGNKYVPDDAIVRLYIKGNDAEAKKDWYLFSYVPVGVPFSVLVTNDGGVAGSDVADCTFTYECRRIKTNTQVNPAIDTDKLPLRPRLAKIEYTAATTDSLGLAVYKPALVYGDELIFQLLYAVTEIESTDVCTPA